MIHPLVGIINVFLTFLLSLSFFVWKPELFFDYYFLSVYLLIGIYTIYVVWFDQEVYDSVSWKKVIPKALGKYVFWMSVLYGCILIYENHQFYVESFKNYPRLFRHFFQMYVGLGWLYFLIAEKTRSSFKNSFVDPYIRFYSLIRNMFRGRWDLVKRRVFKGEYKRFWISTLLRFHYIPVMVEQVFRSGQTIVDGFGTGFTGSDFHHIILMISTMIWLVDSNNGSVGYMWESVFTKTRFRSIDPYPAHWMVTLICYYPFVNFASTFLYAPFAEARSDYLFSADWFIYGTDVLALLFLIMYGVTGCTLGFSYSNLSYKKIQTRGFYSVVRHPATFFKLGYFFVTFIKFREAYTFSNVVAYFVWTGVYVMRTFVEERFLSRYKEYQEYKKKVKYRIIPGVF